MAILSVSKTFEWRGSVTEKVATVCRMFGVTIEQLTKNTITHSCQLEIKAGDVVYITGPSGCGKSVLLAELEKTVPAKDKINLDEIELPGDKTLIDCIDGDMPAALRFLNSAGLNDVYCILNQPANLSDGQKYRFRLATALAWGKKFIFADEFCSNLDRISASVIAYNVQRFAKQHKVTFILAGAAEDILAELSPEVLVIKDLSGATEVIYSN